MSSDDPSDEKMKIIYDRMKEPGRQGKKYNELQTAVTDSSNNTVTAQKPRTSIRSKELERLAVNHLKSGITYGNVMRRFGTTKKHAQDTLFRAKDSLLFTLGRQCPQRYFPICKRSEVLKFRNAVAEATWMNSPIDEAKADNFLQVLMAYPQNPQYIHKMQLQFWADKKLWELEGIYNTLRAVPRSDKAKVWNLAVADSNVCYTVHSNSRVIIDISCSEHPFQMDVESDISLLFAYIGRVYQKLLDMVLCDPRERFTPSPALWKLTRCDLNRDIPITDKAEFTLPSLQLVHAERVFRMYVKARGREAVYRMEESVTSNTSIQDAFRSFVSSREGVAT